MESPVKSLSATLVDQKSKDMLVDTVITEKPGDQSPPAYQVSVSSDQSEVGSVSSDTRLSPISDSTDTFPVPGFTSHLASSVQSQPSCGD